MNWIHCNRCYALATENDQVEFYLTSCGHTFCGRCTDGTNKTCLLHNNECSYALHKFHQVFFQNPSLTLQRDLRIYEFQLSQCASLIHYLTDKLNKYMAQKPEMMNLKAECKRHRDEKNQLKTELIERHDEIKRLKRHVEQLEKKVTASCDKRPSSHVGSGYLFGNISSGNNLSFSPMARNDDTQIFTPPKPVSFPKNYRQASAYSFVTPQKNPVPSSSPNSPDYSQRTLRKVILPGDKSSSPMNRIGLQRLDLKCTPSFERNRMSRPNIANVTSKYPKYF